METAGIGIGIAVAIGLTRVQKPIAIAIATPIPVAAGHTEQNTLMRRLHHRCMGCAGNNLAGRAKARPHYS